jgi:hypothetical protein
MRTRSQPQSRTGVDLGLKSTSRFGDSDMPGDLVEQLSDLLAAAILADIRQFPGGPPPDPAVFTSQASRPRDIMPGVQRPRSSRRRHLKALP